MRAGRNLRMPTLGLSWNSALARLGCEYQVACTKHCIADDAAVNDDRHQENHHHAELGASRGARRAVTDGRQAIRVTALPGGECPSRARAQSPLTTRMAAELVSTWEGAYGVGSRAPSGLSLGSGTPAGPDEQTLGMSTPVGGIKSEGRGFWQRTASANILGWK